MFPDPTRATTPAAPIASKPPEQENDNEDVARGTPRSWSSAESASGKSPEPHWDLVIGAATD
jgi:hypothetical protein